MTSMKHMQVDRCVMLIDVRLDPISEATEIHSVLSMLWRACTLKVQKDVKK